MRWRGIALPFALQDGTPTSKTFEHVGSEVGAEEAEEVGVEHLLRWEGRPAMLCACTLSVACNMCMRGGGTLCICVLWCRDIQDKTVGTLSQQITSQVTSLHGLLNHLEGIRAYLERVATKKLPINHTILYLLQDIFNLLPNLNVDEFSKAFVVKTNDQLLVVYLASLIRAVIALHELIQNKVANREAERQEATSSSSKKKEKEAKEQVCCQRDQSL